MNAKAFTVTADIDSISTECYKAETKKCIFLKHNNYHNVDTEHQTKEGKTHKGRKDSWVNKNFKKQT